MNDLMTHSFLNYVELKKKAMKDLKSEPDIEMGQLNQAEEQNLAKFFEEVNTIKNDMEEITTLLLDLQDLNEHSKSTHSTKVLKGIRDRINSDMVTVLRKAKIIKSRLGSLDKSNMENRNLSMAYKEGSPIDRTRISVTNGLRSKLKDMMNDFQELRARILKDHKEGLKRRYYNVTGEQPSEELLEKMVSGGGQEKAFIGKEDLVMENQERHRALKDIQRSLTELHQVFFDMAALVETQGNKIDNIEDNVGRGADYINRGTTGLHYANQMEKKRCHWGCWIGLLLLILMITFLSILAS